MVTRVLRGCPLLLLILILLVCCLLLLLLLLFLQSVDQTGAERRQAQGETDFDSEFLSRLRGPLQALDPRVIAELRSRYLAPPPVLPYNLSLHKSIRNYELGRTFGWEFYHHYITHFFGAQRGGYFVEAGALDGEFLSNTLWLETARGWTGLLVEADHDNYRQLRWKRRRVWISNTCLTKEPYPRQAVFESLEKATKRSPLEWLWHANTREINSQFSKVEDDMSRTSQRAYSSAQCFPLPSYLAALNVSVIDFLSLDTQGWEWEIFLSLSPELVTVRSVAMEHMAPGDTNEEMWRFDPTFVKSMEAAGYQLVDVCKAVDYFFVLQSDPLLGNLSLPHNIKLFSAK